MAGKDVLHQDRTEPFWLPVLVAFPLLPSPLESSMLTYFLWAIIYYFHLWARVVGGGYEEDSR